MYFRFSLVILLCIWLSSPVFAEFYKYTDENGVVRFTDNPVDIPEKQKKVKSYIESVSTKVTEEKQAKKRDKKIRDVLYEEFLQLDKERKELEKESEKELTPEELKAYNEKVDHYNEKMMAYEKKRKALEKKEAEMEAEIEAEMEAEIKDSEEKETP